MSQVAFVLFDLIHSTFIFPWDLADLEVLAGVTYDFSPLPQKETLSALSLKQLKPQFLHLYNGKNNSFININIKIIIIMYLNSHKLKQNHSTSRSSRT